MTPAVFQQWLLSNGGAAAERLRRALDAERTSVADLERQTADLAASTDWLQEIDWLLEKDRQLDAEILLIEAAVCEATARLLHETELLLGGLESVGAEAILKSTQELFDDELPRHLRQPVELAALPMFAADLEESQLWAHLQESVTRKLAESVGALLQTEPAQRELEQLESTHRALTGEITDSTELLGEHGVGDEVIAALCRLDDVAWFIEDIVEPYTQAARIEADWNLPRDVLRELRGG